MGVDRILCRNKKKTIVEYALANSTHPIGVASYVVSKVLPNDLKDKLPTEEQIARLLEAVSEHESSSQGTLANQRSPQHNVSWQKIVPPAAAQTKAHSPKSNHVRTGARKKPASARKSKT